MQETRRSSVQAKARLKNVFPRSVIVRCHETSFFVPTNTKTIKSLADFPPCWYFLIHWNGNLVVFVCDGLCFESITVRCLIDAHHKSFDGSVVRIQEDAGHRTCLSCPVPPVRTVHQNTHALLGDRLNIHPDRKLYMVSMDTLNLTAVPVSVLCTLAMKTPASSTALICLSQPEFSRPHRKSPIEGDRRSPTAETHTRKQSDQLSVWWMLSRRQCVYKNVILLNIKARTSRYSWRVPGSISILSRYIRFLNPKPDCAWSYAKGFLLEVVGCHWFLCFSTNNQ